MKLTPIVVSGAIATLALASLTGCGGGGGVPSATSGASAVSSCVVGHTWALDVQDTASQVGAHLAAAGLSVTDSVGTGQQTMTWGSDGHIQIDTDMTLAITVQQSADFAMTIEQKHTGPASGTFTIDGSTANPSGWDASAYQVTTSMLVNGVASGSAPFDMPDSELAGVTMQLTCSGDTMTSLANDGFVTYHWTRTA